MSEYKVHKFDSRDEIDPMELEEFLNRLEGRVEVIIPEMGRKFNPVGVSAYVKRLLIVERTKQDL